MPWPRQDVETERLCQREIDIEHCHRLLFSIYALQSTPEELLAHFRLVAAIVEKAQSHVRDVEIPLLMVLFNMISKVMNFDKGTMEVLMVHFIYDTIHPRTIVLFPFLAALQIVHVRLLRLIEVGISAAHLCLADALHHCHLLFRGLLRFLLIRRLLLSGKRHACHQQSYEQKYNLFHY